MSVTEANLYQEASMNLKAQRHEEVQARSDPTGSRVPRTPGAQTLVPVILVILHIFIPRTGAVVS